ncbi:MAG: intracellular septation protein A, partial [Novosphingobium sp.]
MTEKTEHKPGWLGVVVDYGPILLFFAVYKYYAPADRANMLGEISAVVRGTVAFMAGAVVAFGVSLARFRKVSP